MLAIQGLMGCTALWHAAAAYFFIARTEGMLAVHTHERPVSPVAQDMMRFLGGINTGYAVLAVCGIRQTGVALAVISGTLAIANLSQFWFDVVAHRSGRWKKRLRFITAGDGMFAVLQGVTTAWLLTP